MNYYPGVTGTKYSTDSRGAISSFKTKLATEESESSSYHKEKQIQFQQKENAHRDDIMVPLTSKFGCNSLKLNDSSSPASIRTKIVDVSPSNKNKNDNKSLVMIHLQPPLVHTEVDETDNIISISSSQDEEKLALQYELESGSTVSSSSEEDISKYGYEDDTFTSSLSPEHYQQQQQQQQQYYNEQLQLQLLQLQIQQEEEEDYDKYGYEGGSPDIFIAGDDEEDEEEEEDDDEVEKEEMEDCDKYGYGRDDTNNEETEVPSSQYSPTNEYSGTAFCPKRMPRRSSMKGSASNVSEFPSSGRGSGSSSNSRRASIGVASREREDHIEILLPGRSDLIKRRRSIVFDNDVDVQKIEPIKFLAHELWFQENEYNSIKIKTLALLDRVDPNSGVLNGKKYCTRGLEKFMTPEATEVKKHQAWDSVLNEQFLQRKDGEYDEETLANIYKFSTKRSQSEASKRANQDAVAAEAYLKTKFRKESTFEGEWAAAQIGFNRRLSM